MNLHHLLVFHTIAKTGSITSSSKQLNISQPALSRELRVLENRFGVTLFERLPRGMRLTNSGKILPSTPTDFSRLLTPPSWQ